MNVIEVADEEEAGSVAARLVERAAPRTLGVATGASTERTYAELSSRMSLSPRTVLCLLDEYVGLAPGDPRRFRHVIVRHLAGAIGSEVVAPDVDVPTDELDDAANAYERVVRDLAVDLQILGIGRNGHIAFNEPGTPFTSPTHVATLSPQTRRDNAGAFGSAEAVPQCAVTQGIATITAAAQILLVATGDAKASAVAAMLDGPVGTTCPATALRGHPHVTVVADAAALSTRTAPGTTGAR
jgi:glucosamine-6-phosphate deaminase